jgi:predicted dinucleotide-binding enzyme
MTATRIGIIGKGKVGTALQRGFEAAGREVQNAGKEPAHVRELAEWAEALVLAVPYGERRNAIDAAGRENLAGKTLVDVTNALGEGMTFAGPPGRSGAEEVQEWVGRECHVVKAFNTVFAHHMENGEAAGERLTLFCAGDDDASREAIVGLGHDLGFDAVDAGALENARWLEAMGYLNITLAFKLGLGPESGFRYVHAQEARTPTSRPAREAPRTDRTTAPSSAPGQHPPSQRL